MIGYSVIPPLSLEKLVTDRGIRRKELDRLNIVHVAGTKR